MIEITRQERSGEKQFHKEMLHCIRELTKRGLEPTHDRIFDFCRTHPADVPMITRLRGQGMEGMLRAYLFLWGRTRDRIRATIPAKKIQEATE